VLAPYRAFASRPHAAALLAASILARLPLGMTPLALLLLMRGRGFDYGEAGLVVAAYTLALGASAPVLGRLIDRRGRAAVLLPCALVYPLLAAVVVVASGADAPLAAIALTAAGLGLSMPPVGSAVRSLWSELLPGDLRTVVYSLEAAFQEVTFVVGPLLAAALAAWSPTAALLGAGVLTLTGTALVLRHRLVRASTPSPERHGGWLGAIGAPGVRTVVVICGSCGIAFGAAELAMPAFADEHGNRALGGVALAAFAAGSLVGGLLTGSMHTVGARRRALVAFAVLAPALALLLVAWSIPSLVVLAFVAGMPIAPTFAGCYSLLDRVAHPGTLAEAFAWIGTSIAVGLAIGTAVAGPLVDRHGVDAAFLFAPLVVVAGGAVVAARLGTLRGGPRVVADAGAR
jgi:MFS family permease